MSSAKVLFARGIYRIRNEDIFPGARQRAILSDEITEYHYHKLWASDHEKEISSMKRSPFMFAAVAMVSLALLLSAGCKPPIRPGDPTGKGDTQNKKDGPPVPPPPAPTITLTVSPTGIESGQTTTLSWKSSNATGVDIDHNVGTVEPAGRRIISPDVSTTYKAIATGPGGSANAEVRVTVSPTIAVVPQKTTKITDTPGDEIDPKRSFDDFERDKRDVFFDYDQYGIREDARTALQIDIRLLTAQPKLMITIEGYCDERGSDKYNLALGDSRAVAVKDYLVSKGIDGSRIDTVTYGKERPFCEEHNEECYQSNRRARFVAR
jgi:peptidoglycan-associated lipoprotein